MVDIVSLPSRGFNQDVITKLEGLLEEARKGEILGMVFVCDLRGSQRSAGWTGSEDLDLLAGMASRLQHCIQCRIDQLRPM